MPVDYSILFKGAYAVFMIPTFLVTISAFMSAKEMGGTLGKSLKKIAVGSVIHTALITTYLALEGGAKGLLSEKSINTFFLFSGIFGSLMLVLGYVQLYRIAKRLKLFTA